MGLMTKLQNNMVGLVSIEYFSSSLQDREDTFHAEVTGPRY